METMEERFGVALVKRVCPICGKEVESASEILIGKRASKKNAQRINEMNGQVVGFTEKPCEECQSYIDKGAFFIIGVDADKTDDFKNPYRTGHLVGISRESEFFKALPEDYQKKNAAFMDYREMMAYGMIEK